MNKRKRKYLEQVSPEERHLFAQLPHKLMYRVIDMGLRSLDRAVHASGWDNLMRHPGFGPVGVTQIKQVFDLFNSSGR